MSAFAPLSGDKQTSGAPTPSADFMSTHPSAAYEFEFPASGCCELIGNSNSRLLLRRRELLSRQLRQHALPRDLVAHELVELLGRVVGGRRRCHAELCHRFLES